MYFLASGLHFELPASESAVPQTTGRAPSAHRDAAAVVSHSEMEKQVRANIAEALRKSNGRVYGPNGAAVLLGMKPTTLASRIQRWGLA